MVPVSAGINCGVMMFRNSDWSRAFLEQLWSYAHLGDEALQTMHAVSPSPIHSTGWTACAYSESLATKLMWTHLVRS